jgi:Hydrazine synthase alpha subunit middle domain/WD40-like Beta Propeller Repeat
VNVASHFQISVVAAGLVLLAGAGCRKPVPPGALVLTQSPATAAAVAATDTLDSRYPSGSRVVLLEEPFDPKRVQVLSEGLAAAGDPIVSYDGQHVFFAGKAGAAGDWQIYQGHLAGGYPQMLTSMPGGAMSPALLPDGSLVFASPVPKIGGTHSSQAPSALYVQSPGGQPRQLTFCSRAITEPTMLSDGRILFVSTQPPDSSNSVSGPALFTINNDGTEISAFAGPEDPASTIQQPRLLGDGRVVFLVSKSGPDSPGGSAEFVRTARPFQSRAPLLPGVTARVCSVQPASNGDLLVCAENSSGAKASLALFRVNPAATILDAPLLADPAWNVCDAAEASPHPSPMGRLSTMDLTKSTGKILCLNANFSSDHPDATTLVATRVRVLAEMSPGNVCALGEVPVQADGSFLAEVPAEVPIGFEALDENGRVLRREAPMFWVRPAENRSCIGCHEPRNRAPHNHRPLAVSVPITCLVLKNAGPAPRKTN